MNSTKIYDLKDIKLSKPQHITGAITSITKGKRFESYVGWSFAKI